GRDQHDGVEVLDRIELLARLQRHVDGERLRAEMERIAVGRGLRRGRRADIAAGARAVLDDDVLPPRFGELLRENAPERVDGAAARTRDQQAHRPVGIALRPRIRAPSRDENGGSDERNGPELKPHGPSPDCTLPWQPVLCRRSVEASVHHRLRKTQRRTDRKLNGRIGRIWSGRKDSNPRPRPWQGRALPLSYTRVQIPAAPWAAGRSSTYAKRTQPLQPSRPMLHLRAVPPCRE